MAKTLKDLNLCDDFLFYHVMQEPELVIQLLELVLDLPGKIEKVEYLEREKTLKSGYTGKGVRLDVYVRTDNLTVYNIEIQQKKKRAIGKRSRKYQSSIDMEILKKGEDYDKLKPQYIIFICTFDPFDRGLFRYTFGNRCYEDMTLELGDETRKVFLNTKGNLDDASSEMREFLWFLEHSTPEEAEKSESQFVHILSERIEKVKEDEEIGGQFMTFEDKLKDLQWEYEEIIKDIQFEYEDKIAEKDSKLAEKDAVINGMQAETARKLKEQGVSAEIIASVTGLSPEEIEQL